MQRRTSSKSRRRGRRASVQEAKHREEKKEVADYHYFLSDHVCGPVRGKSKCTKVQTKTVLLLIIICRQYNPSACTHCLESTTRPSSLPVAQMLVLITSYVGVTSTEICIYLQTPTLCSVFSKRRAPRYDLPTSHRPYKTPRVFSSGAVVPRSRLQFKRCVKKPVCRSDADTNRPWDGNACTYH